MGVQRIQETSTASYGKSVEAAAVGSSNAAGSGGTAVQHRQWRILQLHGKQTRKTVLIPETA